MKCEKVKVRIDGYILDVVVFNDEVHISDFIDPNDARFCDVIRKAEQTEAYINYVIMKRYDGWMYDEDDFIDYLNDDGNYRSETENGIYSIGFGDGIRFLIKE